MNATKRSPAPFAVVGIFAAFIIAVVWIVAAQNDPSWVVGENAVAELASSDVEITADLFKYGIMLAGILVLVFGAGKAYVERDSASGSSGAFAALAGITLVLVGNYGSEGGEMTDISVWLFFIFAMLAIILSMFGDWDEGKRINGAVSAILLVIVIGAAVGKSADYVGAVVLACLILWLFNESAKMALNVRAAAQPEVKVESI